MLVEKIHLYITIFAGIVMTAVNIYLNASLLEVCIRLIITLAVFYVVGALAENYIRKKIIKPPEQEAKPVEEDDGLGEPTLTDDGFELPPEEDEEQA